MTLRSPEQILERMSRADKLAQLQILWRRDPDEARALARRGIGALFWPQSAAAVNELQRTAVEEAPHGIPLLIGLDVVHGQFTIFPTPIAQAAAFDPDVAELDARVSAAEARSTGVTWTFSPMVDVTRDPRWGRVVEGFGEDPHVASVFGAAKVRGYQGGDRPAPHGIAACLKHFVGYGAAEAGRDYNTTDMSRQRLREVYLEPFRAGVAAGAGSVMAAFNALNGTPMHAHRRLLTDVLTGEYGFAGPVVGDAEGVVQLVAHGVAADEAGAISAALRAGLDVVMGGSDLTRDGEPLAPDGAIDEHRLDDAVLRVLRLKHALGLFENPYVDEDRAATGPTPATLRAARDAAERCVVLLRNSIERGSGDALLPLGRTPRRILLTGPYAHSDDHLGAWVQHFAAPAGTLEHALRDALPEATWTTLPGADMLAPSEAAVAAAAAAARTHDLVIVAVGEPSSLSGEAASRADIRLPGDQERLIHAIADTGVPFIVLLATGRPLVVEDWIERAPAVLLTWHLGSQGPEAIARILTGEAAPGGRLPMTFPRAVGQIPVHHDALRTGRPARSGGSLAARTWDVGLQGPNNTDDTYTSKYLDLELGPRFPFGHGLTYTAFALEEVAVDRVAISVDELASGARITVRARVRNTGGRAGDDVVFLHLADPVASIARPVQRLVGFRRVSVPVGGDVEVTFTVDGAAIGFYDEEERFVLEPGMLELIVGDGADEVRLAVTVTA